MSTNVKQRSQLLRELLDQVGLKVSDSVPNIRVTQVTDDSRQVRPGALFIAAKGIEFDGHRFIPQAIHQGARAILLEERLDLPKEVAILQVPSARLWIGPLIHAFLGSPSLEIPCVGVTGTNGKTTTVWLIQHLLEKAGMPAGLLGTICHRVGNEVRIASSTTPRATVLQESLAQMHAGGLQACAMEVSSHALDQHRTDGVHWQVGVFTNLASEHLDYHQTLQRYLAAKRRLFESLESKAWAVINQDDPAWSQMVQATNARILTFSLNQPADLTVRQAEFSLEGTRGILVTPEGEFAFESPLIGRHNLSNLLAAFGAVRALGVPLAQAVAGAQSFLGVPGRLERIDRGQSFPVFVDYAHTDDALEQVLRELKSISQRKIVTLFGCGGDRDVSKRPRMGKAAATFSDQVIVTSDNPRSEDPEQIACEILAGIEEETPVEVILDRRAAIEKGLELVGEEGLLLIAGKGHENVQVLSQKTIPFNDKAVTEELLSGLSIPTS